MDTKTRSLLEKARKDCYSWRVRDAYPIFRRYFDRLPFQPEPEHAEYIGWFVRVLFELGREKELDFYLRQLEALHGETSAPFIGYPLGVVYSYSGPEKAEAAREIFERLVSDPSAVDYHARAWMMLADYHLNRDDITRCRGCIEEIELPQPDRTVNILVEVWKGVVARREGKWGECIARLESLLGTLDRRRDWYPYFSAKVVVAMAYLDKGDLSRGTAEVEGVRKFFGGRRLKLAQVQMGALERLYRERLARAQIREQSLALREGSLGDKLLELLLEGKSLEKSFIVETLYGRPYRGKRDDRLIYRHIYILRQRLESSGLSPALIVREGNGYTLAPDKEKRRTKHV